MKEVYYVVLTYKKGATWGKMAVGVKVVSVNGERLNLGKVVLRETVGKIASYLALGVGFIMAGFTERKQALHDKIAQTYVVYKDPNQKNNTWVILLILIPVFIAIIGILASIVLVSLSTAREKAKEAALLKNSSPISTTLNVTPSAAVTSSDDSGDPNSSIVYYYGKECPHCKDLAKFLEDKRIADKVSFAKKEVWHNAKNADEMQKRADGCQVSKEGMGVPFVWSEGQCFVGGPDAENFFKQKAGIK